MNQNYFFIRTDRQYVRIDFKDIIYIESKRCYVSIVTEKGTHLVLMYLCEIKKALPQEMFCQVHRSCIVALDKITSFDYDSVFLKDRKIAIGDKFRTALEQRVIILVSEGRNNASELPEVEFESFADAARSN